MKIQGKVFREINSGNINMIIFMMTSLCVLALCLATYEIYNNRKKIEMENQVHYSLIDPEDLVRYEKEIKGVRDI